MTPTRSTATSSGVTALVIAAAIPLTAVAWAALLGLGVARQGGAWAVAVASTVLVFGPTLAVSVVAPPPRTRAVALSLALWSAALLAIMPLYFPGERREAVTTGLALLTGDVEGDGMARTVAEALPDEPDVAIAQVPVMPPVQAEPLPAPRDVDDHEISLPFEGEGRRLSVPVVFEHDGRSIETDMMLDTGATYTTLPRSVLERLDVVPSDDAPELTLNTANGQRQAKVVLLDEVWLGDLVLRGVAITTCEDCAADDNAGLLGLNVTGAYNMTIDADRREVLFTQRARFNRRLDVRPFSDLEARFVRYPGGRVEAELELANRADRTISSVTARITCGATSWEESLGPVAADGQLTLRRRLPRHPRCETYQVLVQDAAW